MATKRAAKKPRSARTYSRARKEISIFESVHPVAHAQALAAINKLQAENTRLTMRLVELERNKDWSQGRRADGVDRVPGFTVTQTRCLRILAATGEIRYDRMEAVQRHMSNIRKKLPPGVVIKTIVQQGYEVTEGILALRRLVLAPTAQIRALDGVGLIGLAA